MKKLINYIKSPESDFILLSILLILVNLVSLNSFTRIDLTSPKSYSLSKQSIELVKTLEEPLSVKVFFSSDLPSPYSNIDQYIRDLLVEYKGKANSNFSVQYFDMNNPENEKLAYSYNLRQVQIQEVKNNEVGFKSAWMGLVFTYADSIEVLDGISSNEGLEYKITSKISEIISTTSALSGLSGKVKLTLFKSSELSRFGIAGFDQVDEIVKQAYSTVNKKNLNRIEYEVISPQQNEVSDIINKYGLQELNWDTKSSGEGKGTLGLVLQYKDNFKVLPVQMARSLFGNTVTGLDSLEESIAENLKALVSTPSQIGYVIGHNELYSDDKQNGSGNFEALISDKYSLYQLDLSSESIPSHLSSIIIDGPVDSYSEEELYKLDQFVLKGGNLMLFLDSFNEVYPEGQQSYYSQPEYVPVSTGLEKLLDNWGVTIGKDYVMDKNCFSQNSSSIGRMNYYFAPMLQKSSLNQKHPVTKNLGFVIMLQNSSIDIAKAQSNSDITVTVLAKSSPESWLMKDRITTVPSFIIPPSDKSQMESHTLAVLLEGKFTSAFEKTPDREAHLPQSIQKGKIFVTGSSQITTGQIIDENGESPVAMFLRNAVDYLNGQEDLCTMRTKGLSVNTLRVRNSSAALIAKYFNEFGIVILVVLTGFAVLLRQSAKRRLIRIKYNPDDSREITKEAK